MRPGTALLQSFGGSRMDEWKTLDTDEILEFFNIRIL